MLSDRRQKVLRALIEEYVARALPVGSRTLTEHYDLGVSSATVRNELSALEEGGYISQPHTSSGRVPTDYGYRTFVDSLIETGALKGSGEYEPLTAQLRQYATELDDLMEKTSAALARLTDCLSIVVAPTIHDLVIKQITLVCMDAHHVMLVLVTQDGQVLNRHVALNDFASPDVVAAIQQFLNEKLAGKSLSDLESGVYSLIVETYCKTYAEGSMVQSFMSEIMACLRGACHETGAAHCHSLGLSSLMSQPEFSNSSALVPIMQVLEDETVLLELLESQGGSCKAAGAEDAGARAAGGGGGDANAGDVVDEKAGGDVGRGGKSKAEGNAGRAFSAAAGACATCAPSAASEASESCASSAPPCAPTPSEPATYVTIGSENSSFGLPGVSVVAGKYGRADSAGVVAVIGPTRMNYSKVISAVRAATQALRDC